MCVFWCRRARTPQLTQPLATQVVQPQIPMNTATLTTQDSEALRRARLDHFTAGPPQAVIAHPSQNAVALADMGVDAQRAGQALAMAGDNV